VPRRAADINRLTVSKRKYMLNDILVEKLNSFCENAPCSVPIASYKLVIMAWNKSQDHGVGRTLIS
jgi:hypothetical protein